MLSSNTRHCTGSTIALAIHSFDPLECRREEESCTIDISLRWSENQTTKEHFSRLVIERKRSVIPFRLNDSAYDLLILSSISP